MEQKHASLRAREVITAQVCRMLATSVLGRFLGYSTADIPEDGENGRGGEPGRPNTLNIPDV
jgi:hypothetical protein